MRRLAAATLLCAGWLAGLSFPAAAAEPGADESPATVEARCAEQGEAMANAAVMRDAGAPRFEAFASARRELERSRLDESVFISHLAENLKALYDPDSPLHGSPRQVGRQWQKDCICAMGLAWAKRCDELQGLAP